MKNKPQQINKILDDIEIKIKALKALLGEDKVDAKQISPAISQEPEGKVVEGIFDGTNMVGQDEQIYPVPANYASKSKLVEGDRLKLTITDDGTFIFKQIGPVEREKVIGKLSQIDGEFQVKVKNKKYKVLLASVTYFKANPGDEVTVIIPKNKSADWAALENVVEREDS